METVELKEYGRILKKRWWLIALVVGIATITSGVFSFMLTEPVYGASTKLIVNQSTQDNALLQQMNTSQISANIMLIETYKEIIRTNAIMDQVAEQYPELGLTPEQLIARIQVSSVNDTQVMTVSSSDGSYENAMNTVNAVANVFKDRIPTIMKIDNVEILSAAKPNANPVPMGSNPMLNILISFMVSLMVSVGLAFLMEYLDDSVKSEADVAAALQVPTYAVISVMKAKDVSQKNNNTAKPNFGEAPYATLSQ
ncbi:Wzz/FepE/Etk N-terminal domain-containing protein [Paenibacillus sp. TRM 82003]|nr:Wzz/FepE/Etk N-terminal domain-containing protein [Paenibacillus sp. TRM 82003]